MAATGDYLNDMGTLFRDGRLADRSDGELLDRFLAGGPSAEGAFASLMARHGPMVMRVCRGVLDDPQDAADAFQATFLVLVRRAGSLRRRGSAANWLFGVARRVALRARADAARRLRHEQRRASMTPGSVEGAAERAAALAEAAPAVHEEVARLPERYRAVVVLCDLEGETAETAAARLGRPVGTVKSCLHRARGRLRDRLTRRGLSWPAVAALAGPTAPGAVEASFLTRATVRAAASYSRGRAAAVAAGAVPARVAALSERSVWTMISAKIAAVGAALAFVGAGATTLHLAPGPSQPPAVKAPEAPARVAAPPARLDAGEVDRRAIDAILAMPEPGARAFELVRLGRVQALRGTDQASRETFGRARKEAEAVGPEFKYPWHPMLFLAETLFEIGDREEARRCFDREMALIALRDNKRQFRDWQSIVTSRLHREGHEAAGEAVERFLAFLDRSNLLTPSQRAETDPPLRAMAGDFAAALTEVRESEELADPVDQKNALVALLEAVIQGDEQAARPVLDAARAAIDAVDVGEHATRRVDDLRKVVYALLRVGLYDEALATARDVEPKRLPADQADQARLAQSALFDAVAGSLAGLGRIAEAREVMAEAVRVRAAVADDRYKLDKAGMTVRALIKVGDYDEATRVVLADFPIVYDQPLSLASIADELEAAGRPDAARDVRRQALAVAKEAVVEVAKAPRESLAGLAPSAPSAPPPPTGEEANPAPIPNRENLKAQAIRTVAVMHARLGEVDAALEVANELGDENLLAALAAERAKAGDLKSAEAIIGRMETPEFRERAWIGIAKALPSTRKRDPALDR